ncbi:zinc ribbon domain-containing protein [Natrialbaceae archaeon A-gly3]
MSADDHRGIDAGAIYLPRFRLSTDTITEAWGLSHASGIDRTAVPSADEDAVTMAIAAAERVLEQTSVDRGTIETVAFATTSPPLEEDASSGRLVRALDLPADCETASFTGSTIAGASALSRALDSCGPSLVVTADCPVGRLADDDHRLGAGAAAFLVVDDAAVPVVSTGWHADERPGVRYRRAGSRTVENLGVTNYERAAVTETVGTAVKNLEVDLESVSAVAFHQPDGGIPYRISRELSVDSDVVSHGTVVDRIGDAGAATVPIGLLLALGETDGQTSAAFFGSGSAAAFLFEGSLSVHGLDDLEEGVDLSYAQYLRERGHVVSGEVAGGGANVSVPNWQRSLDQRYRLVAGRCSDCGALSLPPEGACQSCHARDGFDLVELERTGEVEAVTVIGQGGSPPEFTEQQQRAGSYAAAIVTLTDGEETVRLPAQITDTDPQSVDVGDTVHATVRRIYEQEGVPRYGVKFVPLD